ncbi:variant surface glycoprotein (VSG), putative [Trypanosoma equiperdum]|uniref:Variant surface glycoprotein (VSG), putative n=1 Tax=Trypanosoma equiperdum TaxID=5694 RepID=A0A1G4IAE9_TRYEQ|nr:variant surface glycoprotein (VSG), putative [Trypanosoma equiperdum]
MENTVLTRANLKGAGEKVKEAVKSQLQQKLHKAHELLKQAKQTAKEDKPAGQTKIKELLKTAVYGSPTKTATQVVATDLTTNPSSTTPVLICGAPGTSALAKTVAAVLLCICGKTNAGTPIEGPCIATADFTTTATGANYDNVRTILPNYIKNCKKRTANTITSAEITTALSKLTEKLTIDSAQTTLGKFSQTNCGGSSNNGACVLYTGAAQSALEAMYKAPWYDNLKQAATCSLKSRVGTG